MKMRFISSVVVGLAMVSVLAAIPKATAGVNSDTISVKFAADEPKEFGGALLDSSDVAGAPGYTSANWTNEFGAAGMDSNLTRDTNGVVAISNADVTWSCAGTWATEGKGEFNNCFTGADETLLMGYLDTSDLGGGNFIDVTIDNLPADMAAGYSVVLYTLGGVVNRPAEYTVNGVVKDVIPGGNTNFRHPYSGPTWVQAQGTDPGFTDAADYGNFVVFDNLTGSTVTIHAEPRNFRAVLNAVQVVKNP